MKIGGKELYQHIKSSLQQVANEVLEQKIDSQKMNNRICQERKAIKLLNSIWRSEEVSRIRKYNLYNSIIKSILLCEAEGWKIMETERKKLATEEMDALRNHAGFQE